MSERRASPGAEAAVFLLMATTAWNGTNMAPTVTSVAAELDVSLAGAGLASGTVFFLGSVLGTLAAPLLLGRVSPLGAAWGMALLGAAGNAVCALSPGLAVLLAGRFGTGIALGTALVVVPLLAELAGGVRLLGVVGASVSLGFALALGVGSLLEDAGVDWRLSFCLAAAVALLPLPLLPSLRRTSRRADQREAAPGHGFLGAALASGEMWRLAGLFLATLGVPLVVAAWLIHYLSQGSGEVSTAVAGALGFALFALAILIRPLSGRLAATGAVPEWLLTGAGPILGAAGIAVLAASPTLEVAVPATLLMGVGFSLPYAPMYDRVEKLYPARPADPLAFATTAANGAPIFVIPLLGALIASGAATGGWLALAAATALLGLVNLGPAGRPLEAERA